MKNDLFFIKKALNFDIDKLKIRSAIKTKWKSLQNFYNNHLHESAFKKRIQFILNLFTFKQGIKILDVGCGIGELIIELAYQGGNCIGLDIDKDCIDLINTLSDEYKLGLSGICDDAYNLPFESETFDIVMSEQFFEHALDIDAAIKEQVRVLKRGGQLFIEQANFLNPFTLFDLLIKYPLRTHGKFGGLKWLLTKSKIRKNIYNSGWAGKDEDIHTRFWWKKRMRQYSNLVITEFTSYWTQLSGGFKLLEPIFGNVIVCAKKR